MSDNAGVWIDHRKAVVVAVTPTGEHTVTILSNVEKHAERGGVRMLLGRRWYRMPIDLKDHIARSDAKLLSTGFNNCIHFGVS